MIVVADLMFVSGLPFLVSTLWQITLVTVTYMPLQTTTSLQKGMEQIVSVYHCRGLTVTTAMVDNQFDPLCRSIGTADLNVTVAA